MPIPLGEVSATTCSATPEAAEAARISRRLVAPVREDITNLLRELVQTNSVALPPGGNEARAQKLLYKVMKSRKIDAEIYDTDFLSHSDHPYVRHGRKYSGRPNLVARIPGTGRGRSLLLSGHVDTVPPGLDPWRDDPFSAKVRRGRLYGLGSFDMKGGLAAQFGVLLALKRAGLPLQGDLLCESVVDGEWGGGGGTLAARLRGDRADACTIGEVTNLELMRATRGSQVVDITARLDDRSPESAAEPVSPAIAAGRLLGWVGTWVQKRRAIGPDTASGYLPHAAPAQVLVLEANRFDEDVPWSVPEQARVRVRFHFLPDEDVDGGMRAVRRSFEEFCSSDPFFRSHAPEWHELISPPLLGHELARTDKWLECLWHGASAALRRDVPVTAAEFPSDAFVNQNLFGIPTTLFGPRGAGAHTRDEYVVVKSVLQMAESLLSATLLWCDGVGPTQVT